MNFYLRRVALCAVFFLALAGGPAAADVKVFAAASLTDVLQAIAKDYEAKAGARVSFNFAGSNVLARQIEQGAPADIFFSADEVQMQNVEKAGLVDDATRCDLLSNTLVVIAPKDSTLSNFQAADLARPDIKRIALADPRTVPAGVYSKAYLQKLGLWSKVEGKVVPTANVRAALAAVESANVEAGMVYRTDAAMSASVRVIFSVPRSDGPKIAYPVALLKASAGDAEAKKFLAYLESPAARAVFAHYGFLTGA
jgi:molybdate transport system substrate-binding protein